VHGERVLLGANLERTVKAEICARSWRRKIAGKSRETRLLQFRGCRAAERAEISAATGRRRRYPAAKTAERREMRRLCFPDEQKRIRKTRMPERGDE